MLFVACAVLVLLAGASSGAAQSLPVHILQLSDIHTSQHVHLQASHERLEDLRIFTEALLPRLHPDVFVITGDLVDAKHTGTYAGLHYMFQAQTDWEWHTYGNMSVRMAQMVGSQCQVKADMRGNHDTFNLAARGGPSDRYMAHGLTPLGAEERARVFDVTDSTGCIQAHVIIVDGTPSTGVRGFLNFQAAYTLDDLQHIRDLLSEARKRVAEKAGPQSKAHACPRDPPLFAAGHQTLSVTQYLSDAGAFLMEPADCLPAVLHEHGATVFVSGHLHDAFGDRLHGFHAVRNVRDEVAGKVTHLNATSPGAQGLAATVCEFATIDLLGTSILRRVCLHASSCAMVARQWAASAASAMGLKRAASELAVGPESSTSDRLLELESADWKIIRRFRLLTLLGRSVSFTDARFVVERRTSDAGSDRAADEQRAADAVKARVVPEDPTAVADLYLVHVYEPPDGRYFPARSDSDPWQLRDVRAALYWVPPIPISAGQPHAPPEAAPETVSAMLICAPYATTAGGALWKHRLSLSLDETAALAPPEHQFPLHYAGAFDAETLQRAHDCVSEGASLSVQVAAEASNGSVSMSELRPVHASTDGGTQPMDMGTSTLEKAALFRWPMLARRVYYAIVLTQLLGFLASWLFREHLTRLRICISGHNARKEPGLARAALDAAHVASRLLTSVLLLLLHPVFVAAEYSRWHHGAVGVVAWLVYLAIGPLAVMKPLDGSSLGVFAAWGVCMRPIGQSADSGGVLVGLHALLSTCTLRSDTLGAVSFNHAFCITPYLWWVMSIVARWNAVESSGQTSTGMRDNGVESMQSRGEQNRKAQCRLRWWDVVTLLPIAWINFQVLSKLVPMVRWPVVVLGPAFGWLLPLACSVLWWRCRASVEAL